MCQSNFHSMSDETPAIKDPEWIASQPIDLSMAAKPTINLYDLYDAIGFPIEAGAARIFSFFVLSGLVALLYAPVLRALLRQWWTDPNYSHALLVPIFAGYVLWRERGRWRAAPVEPSDHGLAVIAFAFGLLLLGMLGADLFTTRISLILLISGITVFLSGWRFLRAIAFPVGYLFFMIPLPALIYYQLTFPLQLLASRIGARGLVLAGIHTLREGNLLILPYATLEVVEACSGVRSLLSLLAAVTAYGYLAENSWWKRGLLVFLTVPVVILSNGLRLVATGVLSSILGPPADSGWTHTAVGLAFFALAFLSLISIHNFLARLTRRRNPISID